MAAKASLGLSMIVTADPGPQQVKLDAACEAARSVHAGADAGLMHRAVRFNADLGAQHGIRASLCLDLPECV